jgi:hypothetical protein
VKVTRVAKGDIVLCDRGGCVFHAVVTDREREGNRNSWLVVEPIEKNISYRRIAAREVRRHWKRVKS